MLYWRRLSEPDSASCFLPGIKTHSKTCIVTQLNVIQKAVLANCFRVAATIILISCLSVPLTINKIQCRKWIHLFLIHSEQCMNITLSGYNHSPSTHLVHFNAEEMTLQCFPNRCLCYAKGLKMLKMIVIIYYYHYPQISTKFSKCVFLCWNSQ